MWSPFLEKTKNVIIITLGILVILYVGRLLFIPLSFSILVSFLLYPVCKWMETKGVSRIWAVTFSILLFLIVIAAVTLLLVRQFVLFSHDWNQLKARLPEAAEEITRFLTNNLGVSQETISNWLSSLSINSPQEIFPFLQSVLYSSGIAAVFIVFIPLFAALLLNSRSTLLQVIYGFFAVEQRETVFRIMILSVRAYYNFIKGMAVVYLVVGILNSIGLMIVGVPHPVLFGFIASVLTFIPFVGIIVGSLLPIAISWLTYGSVWYPIGVIIVFLIVQYLEANLIFPLAVSSQLKISSLVTLVSIIVGGIVWGAAGMILFVPFVAILKLVADHVPSLRLLALLLGRK